MIENFPQKITTTMSEEIVTEMVKDADVPDTTPKMKVIRADDHKTRQTASTEQEGVRVRKIAAIISSILAMISTTRTTSSSSTTRTCAARIRKPTTSGTRNTTQVICSSSSYSRGLTSRGQHALATARARKKIGKSSSSPVLVFCGVNNYDFV